MPTYDYECTTCGHRFELFQSMSEDPVKECPECGNGVRRLIGGGLGIIFKGSGFYVTDNRSSSGGSSDRHKPASGDTESSSSGATDGNKDGSKGAKSGDTKKPSEGVTSST